MTLFPKRKLAKAILRDRNREFIRNAQGWQVNLFLWLFIIIFAFFFVTIVIF